jgi:TM2 domain-containing membrane protein YozV
MRSVIPVLCWLLFGQMAVANAGSHLVRTLQLDEAVIIALNEELAKDTLSGPPHERLTAALLALTLGPFGAHRLYFGTVTKVPIIYGITFGGFGVLVILDLAHILFTKDLSRYRRNSNVFMWAKPKEDPTPP